METEILKSSWQISKAEQLIKLADAILKKHQTDGPASPLKGSLVAEMSFKNALVKEKHEEGTRYMKIALKAFLERDILLGLDRQEQEGKPSNLKQYINTVRSILLELNKGEEEKIEQWGFALARPKRQTDIV